MGTPAGAVDFCKYTKTLDLKPVILMPGITPHTHTHTYTHRKAGRQRSHLCSLSDSPPPQVLSSPLIWCWLDGHVFIFYFLSFLGPHPRHREVPRLGVESEL